MSIPIAKYNFDNRSNRRLRDFFVNTNAVFVKIDTFALRVVK